VIGDLTSAFARIGDVALPLVAVALLFHLANFVFRSLAWRNVLRAANPKVDVPLRRIAGAYSAGVAVNAFSPARAGDLVKIALAKRGIDNSTVPGVAATWIVIACFDSLLGFVLIVALWASGIFPALPGAPDTFSLALQHPNYAGGVVLALAAAGALFGSRAAGALRSFTRKFSTGLAVLRSPRRYAGTVLPFQLAAWGSRICASYCLLAAFGLPASVSAAVAIIVVGGIATAVPTPGGVGTQQVMLAYVLHATVSAANVVSFSLATQAGITLVNVTIGIISLMLMFRTVRPLNAVRSGLRFARAN
jgi:hypothetical protein